jgi:hypothetical protein
MTHDLFHACQGIKAAGPVLRQWYGRLVDAAADKIRSLSTEEQLEARELLSGIESPFFSEPVVRTVQGTCFC